jgi:hypothetical protein
MKLKVFLEGVGIGMLAAYFLDPQKGGRRRAQVRDRFIHQAHRKREAMHIMVRDFQNRSQGVRHRVRQRFDRNEVSDDILIERVRSEMGRHVSNFHSLQITCQDGVLTIAGPILASEIQDCLWHARMVPGVKHVVNKMQSHASAENLPELQGGLHAIANQRWTPAMSLVMAAGGLLFSVYGMGRKGLVGKACQIAGTAMIAKAFYDTEHRFDPSERNHVPNRPHAYASRSCSPSEAGANTA